jgi:putative transposase
MPDADLLNAIRADLAASPFIGEGHRKVWARLRILRDIRVSRTRVLRLMRENALLSPHRRPQGKSSLHDGTITTSRPNEM